MRFLLGCLILAGVARADSSVPAPAPSPPQSCRWEDTSYGRWVQSDAVKRAQKMVPNRYYFLQATQRHFLFGDRRSFEHPSSWVYDRELDRVIAVATPAPGALVEAADGALVGVLGFDKTGLRFVRSGGGAPDVTIKLDPRYFDSASVVLEPDGCTAYLGLFDRIATGSALISANLCTGLVRWKADVVQMNVGHSKYFNDVTVEKRGGEILMHGVEAAGCYEQAFDAATGARKRSTFSPVQPR